VAQRALLTEQRFACGRISRDGIVRFEKRSQNKRQTKAEGRQSGVSNPHRIPRFAETQWHL
jgi:hypothetical protein